MKQYLCCMIRKELGYDPDILYFTDYFIEFGENIEHWRK